MVLSHVDVCRRARNYAECECALDNVEIVETRPPDRAENRSGYLVKVQGLDVFNLKVAVDLEIQEDGLVREVGPD